MASIQELIAEKILLFRGDTGTWTTSPYGHRELISRSFLIMLRELFNLDLTTVYPQLPEDFITNVKNKAGVYIKGGDKDVANPSLQINFPSGILKNSQLGLGVNNEDNATPDYVLKQKFSGSISFSSKGRTALEACRISDAMDLAFTSILSDCLGALTIQINGMTASDAKEDKKANDVTIYRFDSTYAIEIPDMTPLFTLTDDYGTFENLTMEINK